MNFLLTFIGKSGMPRAQASKFIRAFKQTMIDNLAAGNEINLRGIGKFKAVDPPEREARNPRTGEVFTVKEGRKITFVPAKALKEKVN